MKISVVVPAYNEEKRIKKCLDSLLSQETKAYEIIVVDNNCTDKTVSIVKKYKQVKIVHEKKPGITPARNAGFNAAKGDVIARCDADSVMPKDWLRKVGNDFKTQKDIVAVTPDFYLFDTPLVSKSLLPANIFYSVSKMIIKIPSLVGPCLAIKRSAWNKVKDELCDDDHEVHEDIDLAIHIAKYGKIYLDHDIVINMSGRRIMYNPKSFFGEYPIRLVKMLKSHRHLF